MLNKWFGMGRFTKDPELRTTQNGKPVASFTLAVDRDFDRDKTDFVACTAWNKTAEFVAKNFRKGKLAIVGGAWQSRKWEDEKGNKHTVWEVQVENIWFGEKKQDEPVPAAVTAVFDELADDGDLPF